MKTLAVVIIPAPGCICGKCGIEVLTGSSVVSMLAKFAVEVSNQN